MKPEGIRKVFAEQGAEGAIYFLSKLLEDLADTVAGNRDAALTPSAQEQKEEGK